MQYTLIMPTGRVMTFYILAVAELYQVINGGTIVTSNVFEPTEMEIV
jgi:hypothetical protein